MAQPGPDAPDAEPAPKRGRFRWVKWVAGIALLALLTGEAIYLWPRLHESWKSLSEIHWGWLSACIAAQAVSLSGFGALQRQLLRAGGVPVSQRKSVAVIYASTAMSVTLPAGQVFSTAFSYRETRRWGASPIVASWQLAISGVIAASGLALIGLAGAIAVGGSVSPFTLIISIGGMVALIYAGQYASTHPDSLERAVGWLVGKYNRIRKQRLDAGMKRVREVIDQIESVKLGVRDGGLSIVWAVTHRGGDVACLAFACYAIGADPTLAGLLITFAIGKAVGTVPFAPGGLVYVDATLIATLTSAAALPASQAVAAAFVYRGVSFILVALVGWIVFLFLFRRHQHEDVDFAAELERPIR
ncbi:lysylphosphatidylglycerol synthase transmembrane domain-containing protein [Antrihabitans spumae]|uniref:YbhN family protein n=1 Tax=Antrihabitans spumae TaxID=3373370 RepID=A0ABW7K157_9NOCA